MKGYDDIPKELSDPEAKKVLDLDFVIRYGKFFYEKP